VPLHTRLRWRHPTLRARLRRRHRPLRAQLRLNRVQRFNPPMPSLHDLMPGLLGLIKAKGR
jgi:hypothetical protein